MSLAGTFPVKFPVGIATTQVCGNTRRPVTFFMTPDGHLCALRGNQRVIGIDFEQLMSVLLRDGPCEFQIPSELKLPHEPPASVTGILRFTIAIEHEHPAGNGTFSICSAVYCDGKPIAAAERIRSSSLTEGIEKSFAAIARHRTVFPQRCFFCRFSDYEPHTTLGNLRCYLGESAAYDNAAAEMKSNADARYRIFSLRGEAVDDLDTCAAFEVRPMNWGYRG